MMYSASLKYHHDNRVNYRDLKHPVAQQLESLVEQYNPEYDRKLKQRTKEVWGPKLIKSE